MNAVAALCSVAVVSAIPLSGIALIRLRPARARRLLVALVSFAAGTMLGAVFLHLLPEAMALRGSGSSTALLILLGFVLFFVLERWLTGRGNLLSALAALLGAAVALVLGRWVSGFAEGLLPVAAGGFIYVAASTLVPELRGHRGPATALAQVAWMLLGILLMAIPGLLG
jgi:zinc transporter ZupT